MFRTLLLLVLATTAGVTAAAESKFLWGVSNSAFQVEGSPADSDYWRWFQTLGKPALVELARKGTGFLTRYEEDFRLAQAIGLNAFRISIAWDRIEPRDGEWDEAALARYETMVLSLRRLGLEPLVTLHHYVLPAWLAERGGILSPDFPQRFARYAEHVAERLGRAPASVTLWLTFCEPMVLVSQAYRDAKAPPLIKDPAKTLQATAALASAHVEAAARIRHRGPAGSRVSIAKAWAVQEPADDSPETLQAVQDSLDFFNHQLIRALMTGKGDFWTDSKNRLTVTIPLPGGRPSLDFIGVNNYGRERIRMLPDPPYWVEVPGPGPKDDLGREIYPEGLYRSLVDASRYGIPLLVTESGLPDAQDKFRPKFLDDTIAATMRARKEGYPVFGYFHWSLTDNLEWEQGVAPRFGLVAIDYDTLARNPRPSYFHFGALIRR